MATGSASPSSSSVGALDDYHHDSSARQLLPFSHSDHARSSGPNPSSSMAGNPSQPVIGPSAPNSRSGRGVRQPDDSSHFPTAVDPRTVNFRFQASPSSYFPMPGNGNLTFIPPCGHNYPGVLNVLPLNYRLPGAPPTTFTPMLQPHGFTVSSLYCHLPHSSPPLIRPYVSSSSSPWSNPSHGTSSSSSKAEFSVQADRLGNQPQPPPPSSFGGQPSDAYPVAHDHFIRPSSGHPSDQFTGGRLGRNPNRLNPKNNIKRDDSSGTDTDPELQEKIRNRKQPSPSHDDATSSAGIGSIHDCGVRALSARETVEKTLMVYHSVRRRLLQVDETERRTRSIEKDGRSKPAQAYLRAWAVMSQKGLRLNYEKKMVGTIPGINVGDVFFFRMEMCLVGLHAPTEAGIDCMDDQGSIAISIVTSSGHEGDQDEGEVLIYSGHGGHKKKARKDSDQDQKLERGNLALDRSKDRGNDIRVTRGFKDPNNASKKIYIYDGLYRIVSSWAEKNHKGFNVYKYKLVRNSGQPPLGSLIWKLAQGWRHKPSSRNGIVMHDISGGVEKTPICVVNEIDWGADDEDRRNVHPPSFEYIVQLRRREPLAFVQSLPACSCLCTPVCFPSLDGSCNCTLANNGEFPYLENGALVREKAVVFECGRSCYCTLQSCPNRVSQKVVGFHFEVYKTERTGWGLRSWDLIPAGAFLCEYIGELTTQKSWSNVDQQDAHQSEEDDDDEYVFDLGHSQRSECVEWDGMYELLGEVRPAERCVDLDLVGGRRIVIDAKRAGNMARFMNHSCDPNVLWQMVVYEDANGWRGPHVAFFAKKNIPPLTELTFDYGLVTNSSPRVRKDDDDHGGKKGVWTSKCLCATPNCRGRFR